MSTRITEAEMAVVVKSILSRRPNKTATFAELRELVPAKVHLSRADRIKSPSRPGEELWEQIVRNIIAHKREGFEGIEGGVRLYGAAATESPKPTKATKPRKNGNSLKTNGVKLVMA